MYLTADIILNQINQKDIFLMVNIRIYNSKMRLGMLIDTDNFPLQT